MDRDLTVAEKEQKILNTFKYYTQGSSVPSDGNCGLHAISKALSDELNMAGSNTKPNSLMLKIFYMFGLENLPNYWWSDEELAVIANDFGYDMYIYNETDRTGIVFGKGIRPSLVLYSVNNNSHWIPGIRTVVPSSSIPKNFTIVENISEVLSIIEIKNKIQKSRSSSNGQRVLSSNKRYNESHSGGGDEERYGSHSGRNNVSLNKRRDENHSRGLDKVQIIKQDGSRPQLEKGIGKAVKGSQSIGEKKSYNGGKKESHNGEKKESYNRGEKESHNRGKIVSHSAGEKGSNTIGEKGSYSGGEKRSHREKEKSLNQKNDEKLLVQYLLPLNDDLSYGMDAVKQKFSLYSKLKNTVLSKTVRQLYYWNRNKKNKYQKLDLFDSGDEGDGSEDIELNAMYNARYMISRDTLPNFVSKNDHKLLMLEEFNASVEPQFIEPNMFQLEPIKYSEFENSIEEVNCCQLAAAEYYPIANVDCCSIGANDYCSNVVVACPYEMSNCPYIVSSYMVTNYACNIEGCPFELPEYLFSDQWVNDKYINDLYNSYIYKQNKIKSVRLYERFYNQTLAMKSVMKSCIFKPKWAVEGSPVVSSVLVAPVVEASVVTASVVASPTMAAWLEVAPGLTSSVIQMAAPAMVALMMVVPEVAVPTAIDVAPSGNDLVTVPVDHNLPTTPMDNNLTVTSMGNDFLVVKSNVCAKKSFSLKQIWKKKPKTQHSKGN